MATKKTESEGQVINLRHKVKATVTEKGAKMKQNNWKVGQEVNLHPVMAEYYSKHGVVKTDGKVINADKEKRDRQAES